MFDPPLSPNAALRYAFLRRALRLVEPGAAVLEIGPGQGALGARLAARFDYLGVEQDAISAASARGVVESAGGRILNVDVAELPIDDPFDLVVACEVLEHLEDDAAGLRSWKELVRPGGMLLLSVPAQPHRLGPWDEAVGHYRRYSRASLRQALEQAGLDPIAVVHYGFPLGYLLESLRNRIAARRRVADSMPGRTASSGRQLQPTARWLGPVIRVVMAPFVVMQRPFAGTNLGTGLVAWARRPVTPVAR